MTFRKTLFWLHLIAGCVAGIVVLIMSLSGLLLTFEHQFIAWSERETVRVTSSPLPIPQLLQKLDEIPPGATLTLRSDPTEPVEIRAGRDRLIYVNPYTGTVLNAPGSGTRAFFQKVTAWHRWLGMEGEGRTTAKAITGACNFAFLFLVISGAYLWLPKVWSWQNVRAIATFRGKLSGKARDFNWHNVFGIWALVPLFFVVLTAMPISYPWASDLVYQLAGSQPPPAPTKKKGPARRPTGTVVNSHWPTAIAHTPNWRSMTAPVMIDESRPVTFTIDTGDGGQPQKRASFILNLTTGQARLETFDSMDRGRQWRTWTRFVHTGEYYGVIGQTIAGLAALAGAMLVWTGIALALRRLAASLTHAANRKRSSRLPLSLAK